MICMRLTVSNPMRCSTNACGVGKGCYSMGKCYLVLKQTKNS